MHGIACQLHKKKRAAKQSLYTHRGEKTALDPHYKQSGGCHRLGCRRALCMRTPLKSVWIYLRDRGRQSLVLLYAPLKQIHRRLLTCGLILALHARTRPAFAYIYIRARRAANRNRVRRQTEKEIDTYCNVKM